MLNHITVGDCLEAMRAMPAGSVDLVVTSPPYNLNNTAGHGFNGTNGVGKWPRAALIEGYDEHHDAMPHEEYVEWQRACLSEMMRLLSPGGAIFYNHKWRQQAGLLQDRSDIVDGFPVRQVIIWNRNAGMNFNHAYFVPRYEVIYLIAKPQFILAKGASGQGDVWNIYPEHGNPHPAPFPLELARRCIASTDAKVVLDPFIGSGTTAVAAQIEGRDWIGIELSEAYAEMARNRLKKAAGVRTEAKQPELFESTA